MPLNTTFFYTLGLAIIMPGAGGQISHLHTEKTQNFRFHALYGITPNVCVILWAMVVSYGCLDKHCQPKHLLWAFYFLKTYLSESVLACHHDADEKTIQKWVWYIIVALLDLEGDVVSLASSLCLFDCHVFGKNAQIGLFLKNLKWEDRFIGDVGATCLVTVDGMVFGSMNQNLG